MKPTPWSAAVQSILVGGIVACVFVIATRHPFILDLTPERRFTLSPHTEEVLATLREDVRLTVFYSTQDTGIRRDLGDLLALYQRVQPRVKVQMLDLDRSPGAADRLGVTAYNTGVAEGGGRRAAIDQVTETGVTNAIVQVGGLPPVPTWFITGHGELDPRDSHERRGGSAAADALRVEGFEARVLEGARDLPAEGGLAIVAGPTHDLTPPEIDALVAWVRSGASLLMLVDPHNPPSLDRLVAQFGVELGHDVVVDDRSRMLGSDGLTARIAYLNDEVIPNAPDVKALLPVAQSMRVIDAPNVRADYLAVSSETTWADVDLRVLGEPEAPYRAGKDRRGPLPLGVFAHVTNAVPGRPDGRCVVLGDTDFMRNLHLGLAGNRDLLLAIAGLLGRGTAQAAARPGTNPGGTFSPLVLTAREGSILLWGGAVLPALLFAAGAVAAAARLRRG
jgi:ABC-type uncharacterized transport system